MDISTERARALTAYLKKYGSSREEQDLREPVTLGGKNEFLHVYRIPISMLMYNIRNGRFAAELLTKEKEMGRELDPTDPQDGKILQTLLLEQNAVETEVLKGSLKEHGQLRPGLVTFDGAVINANRRMAILSQLYEETSKDDYQYLKAAVLPPGVGEKDLWRIEAGLQFAKDLRLKYQPVNELLKLREGKKAGLKEKEISQYLEGKYSEEEVKERLKILDMVDTYLVSIDKPQQYMFFQAEEKLQQFISLYEGQQSLINKHGVDKKDVAKSYIPLGFRLIQSNKTDFRDIRLLKEVFRNPVARKALEKGFDPNDQDTKALHTLAEQFEVALELVKAKKDQERPLTIINKAVATLGTIDKKHKALRDKAVVSALTQLRAKVDELLAAKH